MYRSLAPRAARISLCAATAVSSIVLASTSTGHVSQDLLMATTPAVAAATTATRGGAVHTQMRSFYSLCGAPTHVLLIGGKRGRRTSRRRDTAPGCTRGPRVGSGFSAQLQEKNSDEVDEAGAADVMAEIQVSTCIERDDEQPELAPTTAPIVGEAEEVELAAQVQEVDDFAADVGSLEEDELVRASASNPGGHVGSNDMEISTIDGGDVDGAMFDNNNNNSMSHRAGDVPLSPTSETTSQQQQSALRTNAPVIGSLLDFESPLNLRLATLTRQSGKAFRAIAVHFPMERGSMNFQVTFEDIASGARLVSPLDEVKTRYFEWIAQFHATFIALFLPTLQHANAAVLQNVIFSARPARLPPPEGSYHPRINDDPDHLIFSYAKLRETISLVKRDNKLEVQLLTVAVLNAYPDEWQRFISAPMSCVPQSFLLSAFNFHAKDRVALNKELLHAQLSIAADTILANAASGGGGSGHGSSGGGGAAGGGAGARGVSRRASNSGNSLSTSPRPGEGWLLIFISAPARTAVGNSALPPMQDLLTGQFVEPLTLSDKNVIYILGTGAAAESFACFPLARKGKRAFSILLEDVESQLGLQRPHRATLTTTLAQALESFSRVTWMGLMMKESGAARVPHQRNAFYKLQKRTVTREIVPSFLEAVFSPSNRVMSGAGGAHGAGGSNAGGAAAGASGATTQGKSNRRLGEYISALYNSSERLESEQEARTEMRARRAFFVHINTAGVSAARRVDNPFSDKNGITEATTQLWQSLSQMNPPPISQHTAKSTAKEGITQFVKPDAIIPAGLPTGPHDAPNPKDRAENAVLVAWDVKRALHFLRKSPKLQEFLFNGGKIWCAQYAQYLLKGFNHLHLATIERTLLQFHDGPLKSQMHPLAKLKLVYETQLDLAVNTRQFKSIQYRMDGLLASSEMESQGLQLASQKEISHFADALRVDHQRLEKELQDKIMDFTRRMDDNVRQRINFRSSQDISTIIYGGALCRHLSSRFIPVRPAKLPITCLFPHAACRATGTAVPEAYTQPDSLLGGFEQNNLTTAFAAKDVDAALATIDNLAKRASAEQLMPATAVVVVLCKVKMGGFLEQFSLYCPAAGSMQPEINVHVAIDDILPVSDKRDIVTVTGLKDMIAKYKPLHSLRPLKKHGKKCFDLRNVLIVTNCVHERLECLVDTGIIQTIEETVLGTSATSKRLTAERGPFERVCFANLPKTFPPAPQDTDSFEGDFSELSSSDSKAFSAKEHWDTYTKEFMSLGGYEGVLKTMISHCASVMGTPRDPFRNTHPVPSCLPQGVHGQEQASTEGMLWMVTPPELHHTLQKFLKGRGASSGAEAIERVTVFLSPHKSIDLSFFSALQQLRFTEKKLQLFDEGCLFRAVLPESHDRVHGELCHCVTATGRLSSQSPNLQNIPKEEDLRQLIVSRFGSAGRMIEADYSQLEVVVLAALSRDPRMMQEIRDKVDFHCLRVSLMTKEPYEDVVRKAKVEKDPIYMQLRQQAKVFSFQRQYGAGVSTIATTTGLTQEEVDRLISAEESHYKELGRYYRLVMDCVEAGADRILRLRTLDTALWSAHMRRVAMLTEPLHYFAVPTGSKFNFSKDRKSVPRLKNYPVQGLAGEIVQVMCGKILREFYEKRNYDGKAFLVNTVHDCVWVDAQDSVADQVRDDLSRIMGSTQEVIRSIWPDMKLDVPFSAEVHVGPSLGQLSK